MFGVSSVPLQEKEIHYIMAFCSKKDAIKNHFLNDFNVERDQTDTLTQNLPATKGITINN